MKYRIIHKTEYVYAEPASLGYNEARLAPRSFALPTYEQTCLSRKIMVEPTWNDYHERTDFFGNVVLYFAIRQPHQQTAIVALSEVRLEPKNNEATAPWLAARQPWEVVRDRLQSDSELDPLEARQFVMNSPLVTVFPALSAYAALSFPPERPILEAVHDLMGRIHHDFDFVPGATTITTPLVEVLDKQRGVCQDFAHLMVGCLRAQRLAGRYVSGYIETLPPPGQKKLTGADASHAWCSVYIPDLGWLDFDPTNNLLPQTRHITLAWGRDFADVTPLKGVFFSDGQHKLHVSVDVERLD